MDLPTAGVRDRFAQAVRSRFAIDTRSLAAVRISLGGLLLADLLLRARDLRAFHTDAGVLPRAALVSRFSRPEVVSVHLAGGEWWFQAALFVVAGAFALALLVGSRTTVATVASWALVVSLHHRNPVVLNGGDVLLRLLLFWAMFLPLGERWSVDAARSDGRPRPNVATIGTAALLLQVVLVYLFNAAFKLSGDLWMRGEAMGYVFSLDQFTVLLGDVLVDYPPLLDAMGHAWMAMLLLSPALVLLTGRPRTVAVLAFAGMHLGMLLTMQLGLFPLIVVAGLLAFLPGSAWEGLRAGVPGSYASALGRLPARLDRALPEVSVSGIPGWMDTARQFGAEAVPAFFLVLVVLWNVQTLGAGGVAVPDSVEPAVHVTGTDQRWSLFAPDPLRTDGWYVAPAYLANGSRVDAFYRRGVRWDRPPDVAATYPNARWRKYLANLWRRGYAAHRPYFARYLCERWNRRYDTRMVNVTVYYMKQSSRPYSESEPVERVQLAHQECG